MWGGTVGEISPNKSAAPIKNKKKNEKEKEKKKLPVFSLLNVLIVYKLK